MQKRACFQNICIRLIITKQSSPAEYSKVVVVGENVVDVILLVSKFVDVVATVVDISVLFMVVVCANLSVVSVLGDVVGLSDVTIVVDAVWYSVVSIVVELSSVFSVVEV